VRALSAADLVLLAELAGPDVSPEALGGDAGLVDALLRSPAVHAALLGGTEVDARLFASPFLVFSVLVHRVAAELEQAVFVEEWLGPRRTVPVFDVATLREFLAGRSRLAFLAELLTSYTRVASGSVWRRTARAGAAAATATSIRSTWPSCSRWCRRPSAPRSAGGWATWPSS
jgi:hypothetical protein